MDRCLGFFPWSYAKKEDGEVLGNRFCVHKAGIIILFILYLKNEPFSDGAEEVVCGQRALPNKFPASFIQGRQAGLRR